MCFFNRLQEILAKKNLKITPVINELGFSKGNIGKWREGVIPSGEVLIKLSDYLGCSVDYLLGRSEIEQMGGDLGEQDRKLVIAYHAADEGTRQAVDKLLDLIY